MSFYYFHDNERILSEGSCPDGMENIQSKPTPNAVMVKGKPPVDLFSLRPNEEYSIRLKKVVPRFVGEEHAWASARYKRDQLLAASDWTQLPDVPDTTKSLWATYRQALRDITQVVDPFNVVWPAPPIT